LTEFVLRSSAIVCMWQKPHVYRTHVTAQLSVGTGWSTFCGGGRLKNWVWLIFQHPAFAVLWKVHLHLVLIWSSQSIIKRQPAQHCLHFIHHTFTPLFYLFI